MPSKRKKIAILGGDGIGPEVIREAKTLLEFYLSIASGAAIVLTATVFFIMAFSWKRIRQK